MDTLRLALCVVVASFVALAGCATSPVEEEKRRAMEADIDDILSYEHDPAEVGEAKSCLSSTEYRSYRALGKRHLLFKGRQGRLWVNVLRGRCPSLSNSSIFIMRPAQGNRVCELDRFEVADRFDPLAGAGRSPTCILGEFKPVTENQVEEIENRLEMR
jgi:hypothetical protein